MFFDTFFMVIHLNWIFNLNSPAFVQSPADKYPNKEVFYSNAKQIGYDAEHNDYEMYYYKQK